jgi:hypothetical protein
LSSFKGILLGSSLFGSLLLLFEALNYVFPALKIGFWTLFLKLIPELFLETKSIFFYRLLSSFFLNILGFPEVTVIFSLESLEIFFTSVGGF